MKPKFLKAIFVLFVFLVITSLTFFSDSSYAQTQKKSEDWYEKLYEKDVDYENFACEQKDKGAVKNYFKTNQLNKILSICHNNCPIVKCRPVVPFPSVAKAVRVKGSVVVHVLVNEQGKTIYARILSGHPLMWASVRKAACNTQFDEYDSKHQGVMHFLIDSYDEIDVPSKANIVSQ